MSDARADEPAGNRILDAGPGADLPPHRDPDPHAGPDDASSGGHAPVEAVRGRTARRQNRGAAIGLMALVVALAFGAGLAIGRASVPATPVGSQPAGSLAPGAASAVPTAGAGLPSDGPRLGRADATVVIDYWADYQCPFCARFAETVIPELTSRIADGTVALVHRDYAFLGDESVDAAVAVRCAGREDKFWAMHDAVYTAQQGENQGAFARPRLAQIAASVGLDAAAFDACMDDRSVLVEVLDDTSAGVRSGIVSTPTIDVNGTRFPGVDDVSKLMATVDAAAAGASPAALPTPVSSPDPWSGVVTNGRAAGDAAAAVSVELWMDYQAPGSAVVATELEPMLRTRILAGSIRVEQHDLATLGDESVLAAAAVRCIARQGGPTWFTHDVLAAAAQGAGAGIFTTRNILRFGSRMGLDVSALSACLDDPAIVADVTEDTAAGDAAGLSNPPAVVVRRGGLEVARFSGTLDVTAILAAIDGGS